MDLNKKKTVEINRADSISKINGDIEAIIIYSLLSVCMVSYYIVSHYFDNNDSVFIVSLNMVLHLLPFIFSFIYFLIGAIPFIRSLSKSEGSDYCDRRRMIVSLILSIIYFVFLKVCNG